MAAAATSMLVEAARGTPHVPDNYLFSPELIVRGSTAAVT
jgi:DNA-binding LacI/PurR family transcriptional regulator